MLYTMEQWTNDRTFNAKEGQEVSEDVYNEMLNCMPPETLPRARAEYALSVLNIPVHAGFLMGEPHSCDDKGRQLYLAFGMNDYGRGKPDKHYYYLGLSPKAPTLNGTYYYFDCMNAFITDRYWKQSAFKDDEEAIAKAADYEATLYKLTFDANGDQIERVTLYEPAFY